MNSNPDETLLFKLYQLLLYSVHFARREIVKPRNLLRNYFNSLLCLSAMLWGHPAISAPNVIVIMTDDQGWGDLSIHGNRMIETPHIDRLAEEGVQFTHFYLQPVCSPTRAEFLTGRYHPRSGVYDTGAGGERMDIDERTIANVFDEAGYNTAVFGKWHSGSQYPYHPLGRGFDEFYGFTSGHWGLYFNPMIEHNGSMMRGNGYLPDDYTMRAMQYAEKSVAEGNPFFIYLAFNIPHSPMQVPDRFWEKFAAMELIQRGTIANREDIDHTRAALAMCENIDWNVGRLMRKLKALKVDRDTIVVYLTDNGPNGHRWNGGMKGTKGSTDEGGVRTPLFLRWPGTVPMGKKVTEMGAVIDLLPTLADLADVPVNPVKPLDGVSLKQLVLGQPSGWPERLIFNCWKDRVSVRSQRFRLDNSGELFDISQDQNQLNPVTSQFPDVAKQLQAAVDQWRSEVLEGAFDMNRPFLVGHPDFGVTFLPARDAIPTGSIERSNRWPNDSYFTRWTSEQDLITWDVEVLEPGLYAAEIWYACPREGVGTTLELHFKGSATRANVKDAHDPKVLGLEQTRSELGESPVKIFRRMGLGTIELQAGRETLSLAAPEIPNGIAIEFRLLSLTRVK